jgi:hypothetical protein
MSYKPGVKYSDIVLIYHYALGMDMKQYDMHLYSHYYNVNIQYKGIKHLFTL